MRHIYLVANLDRNERAEKLASDLRRHLDGREDVSGHPRIFVRGGRVSLEGVSPGLARELQDWCADAIRETKA